MSAAPPPLAPTLIAAQIAAALAEDLGRAGDVTSACVLPPSAQAKGTIRARADGVLAGLALAEAAFHASDKSLELRAEKADGDRLKGGDCVLRVSGCARAVFSAERVALNFLGHLSGIATLTAQFVAELEGLKTRICDTRKTTPGLRALEKYAVRAGGGHNHRFGLDDAILIKDNHIAIAGGISQALTRAQNGGHMQAVEIEVDTLDQLGEALAAGAQIILLDNMPPAMLAEAVARVAGRATTEASGGVSLANVRAIAESGVDFISVGALTHSAPCLDLALDIEL